MSWLIVMGVVATVATPAIWAAWNYLANPWVQWHAMPWRTAAFFASVVAWALANKAAAEEGS